MQDQSKADIKKRLIGFIDSRTTDYAAAEAYVPADVFFDEGRLRREVDFVRTMPTIVAHGSELRDPGTFVTVDCCGVPILVVRQDDGSLKAFSNVCRHRGAKVEEQPVGRRKMFSCPYHRWCYNRDGSIRAIPFDDGFAAIDRTAHGLIELPADEYAGLVWVVPTPGEPLDMAKFVGSDLSDDVAASGIASAELYRQETFVVDIEWKVVMDGFLDAYHLQFVHPRTVGPFFHTNIYTFDAFGKHSRLFVARRGIEDTRDDAAELNFTDYAIGNFTLYPGTIMTIEPSHFEIWSVRPDATDIRRSVVQLRFLVPELPRTAKQSHYWDKNWDLLVKTVREEDWVVAKTISDGIAHGNVESLVYGRNEAANQHFHRQLSADVPPVACYRAADTGLG
jgi:phenylpropionate dioxygenase-like ring-hydroxylating dioxygenase large terminal subunit